MRSETLETLGYLLGLRGARTSVTDEELDLLCTYAARSACVAEVGVYEGATSRRLAAAMPANSTLFLVDPFELQLKIEKLLRVSLFRLIAIREVRQWTDRIRFLRLESVEAARCNLLPGALDLVFLDADHSYESVLRDFAVWGERLAEDGHFAFHDSRLTPSRDDLTSDAGPVRLIGEIEAGRHPSWRLVESRGSLSIVGRRLAPRTMGTFGGLA